MKVSGKFYAVTPLFLTNKTFSNPMLVLHTRPIIKGLITVRLLQI